MDPQRWDRKSFALKNESNIYEVRTNLQPPLDPVPENPIPPQNPSFAEQTSICCILLQNRKSMLQNGLESDLDLESNPEAECDSEIEAAFQQSTDLPPPLEFPAENPASPRNLYITEDYTAKILCEDFRKPSKLHTILELPILETPAAPQIQCRFATIVPNRLRKRFIHPNAGLVDAPTTVAEVLLMDGQIK